MSGSEGREGSRSIQAGKGRRIIVSPPDMFCFPPALSVAWLVDMCKQILFNSCFGTSSSPPLAYCRMWLQAQIHPAWLHAVSAAGRPELALGAHTLVGTGWAQCSEGWSVGAVGASLPMQIGIGGITNSVPAPLQRTAFKHDCDDVLK